MKLLSETSFSLPWCASLYKINRFLDWSYLRLSLLQSFGTKIIPLPPTLNGLHDDTDKNCSMFLSAVSQDSLKWVWMKVRPNKCRSVSISEGKLMEEIFYTDAEVIPSNVKKPVKTLGRWNNSTLSDWVTDDRFQSLENSLLRLSILLIRPSCLVNWSCGACSLGFCHA